MVIASMNYDLMNKNNKILSFATDNSANGEKGIAYQTDDCSVCDSALPFGFTDIQEWLATRKPPEHRKHIRRILIDCNAMNYDGWIEMTNGASLNDTFWVKKQESNLEWRDISFYRNDFNENIGNIAFDGGIVTDFSSPTPELSTEGAFAKCWIRENEETYMLKKSSQTYKTESFSEYYGAQLAKIICKDAVEYDLQCHHEEVVSKCRNFTDERRSFVPLHKLEKPKQSDDFFIKMKSIYETYGWDDAFRRMMVLDALILNVDRHFGNAGFLYDANTLALLRPAPVFDHNRSLLFDKTDDEIKRIRDIRELDIFPRFGMDFNSNAHIALTDDIRLDLENLRGFQFSRHPLHNLSEERLCKIEKLIQQQIDNILKRQLFLFKN